MSQLTDLYEKSAKPRPTEARIIPKQAVNFVDVTNQYQTEFTTGRVTGDPTDFTDKALGYYNNERAGMVTPPSFVKQGDITEPINLNRYSPESSYYNPGQPTT